MQTNVAFSKTKTDKPKKTYLQVVSENKRTEDTKRRQRQRRGYNKWQ